MSIWNTIIGAFDPISKTVDAVVTSKEEKQTLLNELEKIKNQTQKNVLEYEQELLNARAKIIEAEIKGESWLQRNWRPILMISIVAIVVNNYLVYPYLSMFWEGAKVLDLPNGLWTLMTAGVTGYVVGRSGEKIGKNLKNRKRLNYS